MSEVARIHPGQGVVLADGTAVDAAVVVSNADPCEDDGDAGRRRVHLPKWQPIPMESATVKVTFALSDLPDFGEPTPPGRRWRSSAVPRRCTSPTWRPGAERITDEIWCELYFQTPYDPSIAPPGKHVLSAFCQYAPYTWADGRSWDEHRDEVGDVVTRSIARFAPGFGDLVEHVHVQGPPDIETTIGLTGATSSRARSCPSTCGSTGCRTGPGSPACTCAAPPPIRAGA
jgi:phytoene dehydrogenase-like protein